ncbi:MAG: two pore domain potassium channel family protein [Chloroflexi bacterium]|nr:MAG: two pore domain potassium channel family protein [Chloroflexota bacterium]
MRIAEEVMIDSVLFVAGLVGVGYFLNDVFQGVVVPRPTPGRFRLSRWLIRPTWKAWRWYGLRISDADRRERMLGTFAPLAVILLLICWMAGLIISYGLMLYALRSGIQPPLHNLGEAFYFAGVSVLTLGFGDILATGGLARLIVLMEAISGLGLIALAISFLFSLYASLQRRETQVVTLDARAGAPPSAIALLETYAKLKLVPDLPRFFADWEVWAAQVLDQHLAYPLLAYFRSSHDNESWVSALGAVLDTATLVLTTIEGDHHGEALMMYSMGRHLVEDLSRFFRLHDGGEVGVEPDEFDQARDRLHAAGYRLRPREQAWKKFVELRSAYADPLNTMAKFWAAPPAQWIGDRSYVRLFADRHQPEANARAAS